MNELEDNITGNETNNDPHQQLGSLGFMLGSLIAGTSTPERTLESVQSSEMLSNSMKNLILKTVEDERARLSTNNGMMQEAKNNLMTQFKRFI